MPDHTSLEFCRNGVVMFPDPKEKDPGIATLLSTGKESRLECTCMAAERSRACGHNRLLKKLVAEMRQQWDGRTWTETFAASRWYRISQLLWEGDPEPSSEIRVGEAKSGETPHLVATSPKGLLLARIFDASPASLRLSERLGKGAGTRPRLNRAGLLEKLSLQQRTAEEEALNHFNALSRRQSFEKSFWGRLAYHCFREYGDGSYFLPSIELESGDFTLAFRSREEVPILELVVPRRQVRRILAFLAAEFPGRAGLAIHPIPFKSILMVSQTTKLDLEVRPVIKAVQDLGEARYFESRATEKYTYGDLVFIRELGILAEIERPGSTRRFASPVAMTLKKSQVPSFLNERRRELEEGSLVIEDPQNKLSILREFDFLEVVPAAWKRSWYWLSIRYGFGDEKISLWEILRARREGMEYLETKTGWVDLSSPAFRNLEILEKRDNLFAGPGKGKQVRLSAADLLRFTSSVAKPVQVHGEKQKADLLKRLIALQPCQPLGRLKGLATPLRPYQKIGVDWLKFLFENQLAGLLCDDMGLGKTHQAMALMLWLKERAHVKEPCLVVCPKTVISHWRNKIQEHAPGLTVSVHYGSQRELEDALEEASVLLTSYGVLRNDIFHFKKTRFALVIFDEIQNLKNSDTLGHQAARLLQAAMRIGLTGTPIENSLLELKALFDLILPGYLGTDEHFTRLYGAAPGEEPDSGTLGDLRRITRPFVLRRLKSDVLDELPEKIEDVRTCSLSDAQVKLYRDALAAKGKPLLEQLKSSDRRLPYIHIFALLSLLKRICDHPALVLDRPDEYQRHESGKWELFQELLFESLDNGQKVVVFSQYLGMIAMMELLLTDLGVGYTTLTGASENRGELVRRFNEDADCRVFLGSLKAGGAGIDLIAGSVVLHYDRWWNAAREDQATDRVYRIGQKRAVQVFKLITEGTLEEKISAIIDKKRRLMNTVVQADDPRLSKVFSRQELIDLLQPV